MSDREWLIYLLIICGEDEFCDECDELVEVMLLFEIVFFRILIFINEGEGVLWIGEILCWEGLLMLFKVSGVEGEWTGRHSIGGILVLQGIGEEEVEFLQVFVISVVNDWKDTVELREHSEEELEDE